MKKVELQNINGVLLPVEREMTAEEIAELEILQSQIPIEQPTQLDRIEAQVLYTALMTDTLIEEE